MTPSQNDDLLPTAIIRGTQEPPSLADFVSGTWLPHIRDKAKPISDIFLFWKELCAELGLGDMTIRDLRNVFADWQLRSGMSVTSVKLCLGIGDMRHINKRMIVRGAHA